MLYFSETPPLFLCNKWLFLYFFDKRPLFFYVKYLENSFRVYLCRLINQTANMPNIRFQAFRETLNRKPVPVEEPNVRRSELYGVNVFNTATARHYMPKEAYDALLDAIHQGARIDRKSVV